MHDPTVPRPVVDTGYLREDGGGDLHSTPDCARLEGPARPVGLLHPFGRSTIVEYEGEDDRGRLLLTAPACLACFLRNSPAASAACQETGADLDAFALTYARMNDIAKGR